MRTLIQFTVLAARTPLDGSDRSSHRASAVAVQCDWSAADDGSVVQTDMRRSIEIAPICDAFVHPCIRLIPVDRFVALTVTIVKVGPDEGFGSSSTQVLHPAHNSV